MKRPSRTILDIPGCILELSQEASVGNGEDAFGSFLHEDGCSIVVFDGCGGSGAQKHRAFHGKTEAYIASRKCRDVYFNWYKHFLKEGWVFNKDTMEENLSSVKKQFVHVLRACQQYAASSKAGNKDIHGSVVRPFPSTVSAILCDYYDEVFSVGFLWAGNSRGYVLNRLGLAQVTEDDIDGNGDALENLRNDASLTNVLSADGNFELCGLYYEMALPVVLITATDGCFEYLQSPMHFEYMLLSTMTEASSYIDWKKRIDKILSTCAADDYSIVIGCFGFPSFKGMQNYFAARQNQMKDQFIEPLSNDYNALIDSLWQQYKPQYYRRNF